MTSARWLAALALCAAPGLAQADEGSGCGGFRWPIDHERAALLRVDKPSLPNGGTLGLGVAATLELQPFSAAGLPKAPERPPRSTSTFAGHFLLAAPAKPGAYKVTVSSQAWIDVLDGGTYLHPVALTGAKGCEGARRSLKFDLPARPLALQFSGVAGDHISVIVSPDQ